MIRYWCDHCGKEVDSNEVSIVSRAILEGKPFHLCKICKDEWDKMELDFWRNDKFVYEEHEQKCISFLMRRQNNDK